MCYGRRHVLFCKAWENKQSQQAQKDPAWFMALHNSGLSVISSGSALMAARPRIKTRCPLSKQGFRDKFNIILLGAVIESRSNL